MAPSMDVDPSRPMTSPLVVKKNTSSTENRSNGYTETKTTRESNTTQTVTSTSQTSRREFSIDQQITVLRDTVITTRTSYHEHFDDWSESSLQTLTIDDFLRYIEHERLTHMPHQGSTLDRVLKWAEYFAVQVSRYATAVSAFVPDSDAAAILIWEGAKALLELGPENGQALESTFHAFYKLGLALSIFLRHNHLLYIDENIRREVGEAFNDMLLLVSRVSIHYRKVIRGISRGPVILDFNQTFGLNLETFYGRKARIVEAMWKYKLGDWLSLDVRTLRAWLQPSDSSLKKILRDRKETLQFREEFTCEWFQRSLLDLSRGHDSILAVTGPAGCGKTYLSSWIVERLQRPLGKKSHEVISCSIQSDIPAESTSLSVAQNLAVQLLEVNVGDEALFKKLAAAYDVSKTSSDEKVEKALWQAIDIGLDCFNLQSDDHMMIVLDGLDELDGGKDTVTPRLQNLLSKRRNVQAILLARSFSAMEPGGVRSMVITPDHTHHDLGQVIIRVLCDNVHYKDQNEHEREAVIEKLVHNAKGSFLWAVLTAEQLKKATNHKAFMDALNTTPKTLDETLLKIFGSFDFSKPDFRLLLSCTLAAERPLSIDELRDLLSVDLEVITIVERRNSLIEDLAVAKSVFSVHGGYVRIKHGYIRSFLLQFLKGRKKPQSLQQAHKDLTLRLLAYLRCLPQRSNEPTFERIAWSSICDRFRSHHLMEYAIRNWTLHFRRSDMFKETGQLEASAELKPVFPTSTSLALMEWTCWESQYTLSHAMFMHDLALRVRTEALGEHNGAVMQNLIVYGILCLSLSKGEMAATYFYRASVVGQAVLQKFSTVTADCTLKFLSCTDSITITTRTEIVTKREEMLDYIIKFSKHTHGESSEVVINYYKVLARLYVEIREEVKSKATWLELQGLIIKRFGKGSEEEASATRELFIVLNKGHEKKEKFGEYDWNIFQTTNTLEIWDIRRIESTFKLALTYESQGEMFLAEELYITLWTKLTHHCHQPHNHYGVEVYISVIDVALEYARFLRRCKRHEEAGSILICIWEEYEDYEFDSETLYFRLKLVGELLQAVSLWSIAISVFKKCWSWFSLHQKTEHMTSCELLIQKTVKEIIVSTKSTTIITTTTETIVKEVFESAMSKSTVTTDTISTFQSLISLYMRLENWKEAIVITERSLTLIWKMVVFGSGTCALPKNFDKEAIDMAICLAECHYRSQHFHEAEEIYVRIYRACRTSCHIDDERLTRSYVALLKFYEEHRHWMQMIEIYKELLIEYRQHLGKTHKLTIKTLYVLGRLCSEHGFGHGHEYYEEIVLVCNGSTNVCHSDAKDAMIFLCQFYHEFGCWEKLQGVCHTLWTTWKNHHHTHEFQADFIELLYKRYVYVLQYHIRCEYEVLRNLTIEFRDTSLKVFTVSSHVAILAMIELAEISMKSTKHIHEAVTIYEEVITRTTTTKTTTVISEETIKTVKKRLSEAYIEVCSHESVTKLTIEKAIEIVYQRFEYLKSQLGFTYSETLVVLGQLVLLQRRLNPKEYHGTVTKILHETVINIVTKENLTKTLQEAALTIGAIYETCQLREQGLEILTEIRRQIITKTSGHNKKFGFKLNHSVGKSSYVFIITLERILRGSATITYSEILTELLMETTLYEHYSICLKSEKDLTITLIQAGRLGAFLAGRHRHEELKQLEDHTFQLFIKKWGGSFKTQNHSVIMVFYRRILTELSIEGGKIYLGNAACAASNQIVAKEMSEGRYKEAYDVAACAFQFIVSQNALKHMHNIGFGVKLSTYLANRGLDKVSGITIPSDLYSKMIELSQDIIKVVLKTCTDHGIELVRLPMPALNDLVGLLGAQQNYAELEALLITLWQSREVQKNWTADIILALGLRLVWAHKLSSRANSDRDALRLCEDICYNLRGVWGALAPETLQREEVLSQLYTAAGHYREAMGVHEDILRLIVEGDDGDDRTQDTVDAEAARRHIELLKRAHLRLRGWDKSEATYKELVDGVIAMYKGQPEFHGVSGVEAWSLKEEIDAKGKFVIPTEWTFATKQEIAEAMLRKNSTDSNMPKQKGRPSLGVKRVSSNWGLGTVQQMLFGEHHDRFDVNGRSNGNGKVLGNGHIYG